VGAERWDEQVGSVADEAGRLLESLRRSAAEAAARPPEGEDGPDAAASGSASGSPRSGAPSAGMPGAEADARPDGAAHDPFCTWCPLCRGAAVIRSLSPETLTRLADLASLAATVLTDLAGSRPQGGPPASTDHADADASPRRDDQTRAAAPPRSAARPRRTTTAPSRPIPVSDADDPQEAPRG
jgi:hypothetical protein